MFVNSTVKNNNFVKEERLSRLPTNIMNKALGTGNRKSWKDLRSDVTKVP
jgi:hypothetical protein